LFDIAIVIFEGRASSGKVYPVVLAPLVNEFVNRFASGVGMDTFKAPGEGGKGSVQSLKDPGRGLVQEGEVDSPAGFDIGHGEGVTKLPGGVTAVMLHPVDWEEGGRFMGVLEPGKDRGGAMEEADGLGTASSADLHLLFRLSPEAVDGGGTDGFEFEGDAIGQVVFFSESDEVKVQPEEGSEQFSAGPVEVFPEQFE
jgi:hypothetical protein